MFDLSLDRDRSLKFNRLITIREELNNKVETLDDRIESIELEKFEICGPLGPDESLGIVPEQLKKESLFYSNFLFKCEVLIERLLTTSEFETYIDELSDRELG